MADFSCVIRRLSRANLDNRLRELGVSLDDRNISFVELLTFVLLIVKPFIPQVVVKGVGIERDLARPRGDTDKVISGLGKLGT